MMFVASTHDKHKKRHSVIIEALKNCLTHDALCPTSKKNVWVNSKFEVAMNSQACFWSQMKFRASNYKKYKKDI